MSEKFSLGTLLSITDGALLTTMDEVYRVIDYVTGTQHLTHQLGRAAEEIKPWLLRQHSWLADEALVFPEGLTGEVPVRDWLANKELVYGGPFDVEPMPPGMYQPKDPMIELRLMAGPDKPIIEIGGDA